MVRLVIGIIIGVVIIIFGIQNLESVDYIFLGWTLTAPRAVVVIGVFLVGLLSGWLFGGFGRVRRRR